jgi:hypothetical protein
LGSTSVFPHPSPISFVRIHRAIVHREHISRARYQVRPLSGNSRKTADELGRYTPSFRGWKKGGKSLRTKKTNLTLRTNHSNNNFAYLLLRYFFNSMITFFALANFSSCRKKTPSVRSYIPRLKSRRVAREILLPLRHPLFFRISSGLQPSNWQRAEIPP